MTSPPTTTSNNQTSPPTTTNNQTSPPTTTPATTTANPAPTETQERKDQKTRILALVKRIYGSYTGHDLEVCHDKATGEYQIAVHEALHNNGGRGKKLIWTLVSGSEDEAWHKLEEMLKG